MRPSPYLVVAAVLALSAPGAYAQQARGLEDTAVPRDLVIALLGLPRQVGAGDGTQIWVGTVPQNLSRQLYVPTTARVLGGAGGGNAMAAVLSFPMNQALLRSVLRKELAALGWTAPGSFATGGGGFRPMPAAMDTLSFPYLMCQGTSSLNITPTRRDGGTTIVAFVISTGFTTGTCSAFSSGRSGGPMRTPFPVLYNPADASGPASTMMSGCSQGNMFSGSSSTGSQIATQLSNDALMDHYARQLRDSGWTAAGVLGMVGRTFTRADSAGRPEELTITSRVMTGNAACRELNMQVRTARP